MAAKRPKPKTQAPQSKPLEAWAPGARAAFDAHLALLEASDERHRCEVRWVCGLRAAFGVETARRYLDQVRKKRGDIATEKLKRDAQEQWDRGNRGQDKDWREAPKEAA